MKVRILLLIIGTFFLISFIPPCFAQEAIIQKEGNSEDVFMVVEKMPEFEGGKEGIVTFLKNNLKYPTEAAQDGISGTVYVTFVVDTKGDVIDEKIARGVDKHLDAEALRVIRLMSGKWTPGVQRGKNVKVAYTLPIKFFITGSKKDDNDNK